MKVLQLIDSLQPGGAERVAINMANALISQIEGSYLCSTRDEGILQNSISNEVKYLFLKKKSVLDIKAILKLVIFVKKEKIDIIHAHSSSFFLATIIVFFNRNVKLVWHDHYGNSDFLENRRFKILRYCSQYFNHVVCVNRQLESWAKRNLKTNNISYLPNVAVLKQNKSETNLKGGVDKRIICLANLRPQKDHIMLINAFKIVVGKHQNWTLHLVGKDFNDTYSTSIKTFILNEELDDHIFIYGGKSDIVNILSQSSIGVLSSKSEGLPIALLEYGLSRLPPVVTNVGECSAIIENNLNGLLVAPNNPDELSKALLTLIENEDLRVTIATRFYDDVKNKYSQGSQIKTLLKIYKDSILRH